MFKDNASCLATIEGKQGVLSVLDEICILPQGTDERFSAKVRRTFTQLNALKMKLICFRCGRESTWCLWIHSTQPEPVDSINHLVSEPHQNPGFAFDLVGLGFSQCFFVHTQIKLILILILARCGFFDTKRYVPRWRGSLTSRPPTSPGAHISPANPYTIYIFSLLASL